jgi:hypothetical protein
MSEEIANAVSSESVPAAAPSETPAVTETPAVETPSVEGTDSPATPVAEQENNETPVTPAPASHQKTLEERVQELTEKRVAEVEARLTSKLQEVTQAPVKLDFIPDLDMTKVNDYIRDTRDAIEQLQLEGKYTEAEELLDTLTATRQSIKANEQRKQAHMEREGLQQQSQQQTDAINEQIAAASVLVAKEHNIPPEVWKAGEDFFLSERQSKPLIDAQYREKVMLQGPVAAMLWAKDYVTANMGKKESDLIATKEAAKATLPQGKTAAGVANDAGAVNLAELKIAAGSGNPQDIAAYSKARREASA